MLSWEDYRLILFIARWKGLKPAADALGVTLSTVFRRLQRIEEELGFPLFDRASSNYFPTEVGSELVRAAEKMEHEAVIGGRALTGHETNLKGTLRITATESLATYYLAPLIPPFCRRYPDITVTLEPSNRRMNLEDREADIAIRPRRPAEEYLVGRRVGKIEWGIYCSVEHSEHFKDVGELAALTGKKFIAWETRNVSAGSVEWIEKNVPEFQLQASSSSLFTNAELCANSDCLVALPCLLGDSWNRLAPVLKPLDGVAGEIWVVIHEDLRRNGRIRAFLDYLSP